jgi:pyrroloquinoline quinone biosynthesis protein B
VLAYLSGVGAVSDAVRRAVEGADCVFFDGTFWSADELPGLGLGTKRAEDMAHLPIGGADGSLARLNGVTARRRIFIHLNNTNPLLRDDSPERAHVEAAGWEVARDGMEVRI